MKILLSAAATAVALTALAGCGGDDSTTAEDPASKPPSTSTPADPPEVGTYPELDATDYTYVLDQVCFCPIAGPVKVTVEDGEVTSAVVATNQGQGILKGSDAPTYLWITINDVIAEANNTEAADVEVTWPEGQDWPSSVAVDKVERATDDEVTYVISDVQIAD